jgi:hypothetical protein
LDSSDPIRIRLKLSTQRFQLDRLAKEAAEKANAKEQELNAQLREFQVLPAKAEALQRKPNVLANNKAALDTDKLNDEIKAGFNYLRVLFFGGRSWAPLLRRLTAPNCLRCSDHLLRFDRLRCQCQD